MEKDNQKRNPFYYKEQCKDIHFQELQKTVNAVFYRHPNAILMVEIEIDSCWPNICRYVSEFKKECYLLILKQGYYEVLKYYSLHFSIGIYLFTQLK